VDIVSDNGPGFRAGDGNTNFSFTDVTVETFGDEADGFDINDGNNDFSFTDVDIVTNGDDANGFDIEMNNSNFTFEDVSIETHGVDAHGIEVNTGHANFDVDGLFVTTVGDGADGINLQDGNAFSLDGSTFDGLFNGDVLDFTNVTNLSGDDNEAIDFGGMLFNDGGGNTGSITFTTVDADDDGVNEGPTTVP